MLHISRSARFQAKVSVKVSESCRLLAVRRKADGYPLTRLNLKLKVAWKRENQAKNRFRIRGDSISRSSNVRKSMVLNWGSSAGGPQIFVPRAR